MKANSPLWKGISDNSCSFELDLFLIHFYPKMTTANNGTNATLPVFVGDSGWTVPAVGEFVLVVLTVVANCTMFFVIRREKSLPLSFRIYLLCLLVCNALYAAIECPIDILRQITTQWVFGSFVCSINIYNLYVLQGEESICDGIFRKGLRYMKTPLRCLGPFSKNLHAYANPLCFAVFTDLLLSLVSEGFPWFSL